jgi:hypothetical protein
MLRAESRAKSSLWCVVLLFFGIHNAAGSSLSLEAHETGTGDGTVTNWFIDWDYYGRSFTRQKRLLITVRDFSRKVPAVTVQLYFIGHPIGNSEPLFVYGHASFPVELHGDLEVKGEVDAPPLAGDIHRYGNFTHSSGADIDGWIVIGESEGRTFQVQASRQRLRDLAERDRPTLESMVAEYERHKPHR